MFGSETLVSIPPEEGVSATNIFLKVWIPSKCLQCIFKFEPHAHGILYPVGNRGKRSDHFAQINIKVVNLNLSTVEN